MTERIKELARKIFDQSISLNLQSKRGHLNKASINDIRNMLEQIEQELEKFNSKSNSFQNPDN